MLLRVYVWLWSLGNLSRVLSLPGAELVGNAVVAATSAVALAFPLRPAAVLAAFGVRIGAMLMSLPFLHDSQHWCLQTDAVVAAAALATLLRGGASPRQ